MTAFQDASARFLAGDIAGAESGFRTAAEAGDNARVARLNLATILSDAGRLADLEDVLRAGLPDPDFEWRLAALLLSQGRWEEGWRHFEARRRIPNFGSSDPKLSFPEWTGEPIETLLVTIDQGLGDQIMFARWLPLIEARTTLLCPPQLAPMFASLGYDVIPAVGRVTIPRHDAWIPFCSLPYRVGSTPPAPLAIPSKAGGSGVGVCAIGNSRHANDRRRSLPPDAADRLLSAPGAVNLHPSSTGHTDFLQTACLIAGLERVVTVDTAVAHLSASMGKPTTILLPHQADWRWMRGRSDSPWYPSVTLSRQATPGDWASALDSAL